MSEDIRTFAEIAESDVDVVGGKGLSLGQLAHAGLPVPPGFCVTTAAHRHYGDQSLPTSLVHEIAQAYEQVGRGPVAVRSSATAEDGAAASFAGQQETYLGIEGEKEVCAAIQRCWASLDSARARSYRQRQGAGEITMAVVVQKLVPAEVAGVLFTRDPLHPDTERMVVEASWGLGESVVSGRVTPDRFVLDRRDGRVVEQHLGHKTVERQEGEERPVSPERQNQFCLSAEQLAQLTELGRQIESYYGAPRDVEWAWAGGQIWLLQARPITTAGAAERAAVRQEEITALKAKVDTRGTVWGRFNLAEVLPEPTPMTWAIVRRFMSGQGGYGRMFADLGFPPDHALDDECVYDLICGRPYMNLSREPRMQWGRLPFGHDYAALKADPGQVPYSQSNFRPKRGTFLDNFRTVWRLNRANTKVRTLSRIFAEPFRRKIIPEFGTEVERALPETWTKLEPPALLDRLEYWIQRTLITFARESLKPTAFAATALARLQVLLEKPLGAERARAVIGELGLGIHPDPEADLPGALRDLAAGRLDRSEFVAKFGHRSSLEMELSHPRWNEDPTAIDRILASASVGGSLTGGDDVLGRVAAEHKLHPTLKLMIRGEAERMRTFVALRETGKHHLLRGYALIRRALVELDRRFGLNGGIFFLTPAELPQVLAEADLTPVIAQRRKRRAVALSLEAPPVLFSDDLEAIGRPLPPPEGVDTLKGVPLSAGVAEGPALVLTDPDLAVVAGDGFILVCPSTDPSWVPLFARAKGLVMETGGVLSHGAIVAREFGLPAVAGLPDVVRRLKTGQRIRVDGGHGVVSFVNG